MCGPRNSGMMGSRSIFLARHFDRRRGGRTGPRDCQSGAAMARAIGSMKLAVASIARPTVTQNTSEDHCPVIIAVKLVVT